MVPRPEPLDLIPFTILYLVILGLLFLAAEAGFQAGRAWQHRVPEKDNAIGAMTAATLGLVGFLLAFMTSYAADRFDTRRRLVLEEANAIGTGYLRAGYLPEPFATESRQLLSEYLDVRASVAVPGNLEAAIARSEEIQLELWRDAEELVRSTGGSDVVALYVESINEVVELHTQREIAALYARVPLGLILALFAFSLLGMFVLGLNNSYDGRRSLVALVSLVLVFGSVLALIMDLDRSRDGLFQVSDRPLILLQDRIQP